MHVGLCSQFATRRGSVISEVDLFLVADVLQSTSMLSLGILAWLKRLVILWI